MDKAIFECKGVDLGFDRHAAYRHSCEPSINRLWCLLFDGTCIVLGGFLGGETCFRAIYVEVAAVVHGLLETVALPSENVITMGGGTTDIHAVDEWVRSISWPDALVGLE